MQELLKVECPAEIDHLVNANVCDIFDRKKVTNVSTTKHQHDYYSPTTQTSPAQEIHENGSAIAIGGTALDGDLHQNITIENPKGFEGLLGGFNKVLDYAASTHAGFLDVLDGQAQAQTAIASELNKSQTGRDVNSIIQQLAVPVLVGVAGLLIARASKGKK